MKKETNRPRSPPPSVVTYGYELYVEFASLEETKAMGTSARITITQSSLVADAIEITDQPTIGYIAARPVENRVDAFVNCVQLGARVAAYAKDRLGATDICEKIDASADSARKLLNGISETTTQHIDQAVKATFGKDGTVSKVLNLQLNGLQRELEGKLDPDKAMSITGRLRDAVKRDVAVVLDQVRKDLDLSNPRSPMGTLKADVATKLQALDEKVSQLVTQQAVKSAVSIEHLRGVHKGPEFEEAVHAVLGEMCRHRQDQLDRTATEAGLNGRSKRGDFVVELNPRQARGSGLRIAIEVKNNQAKQRDLLRELSEAMDNRGAQFGIGISTCPTLFPVGAPPIEFSSDNQILLRVDDYDAESGEFDPIYLEVALNVARFVCITTRDSQPCKLDVARLDGNIAEAINALGRLSELKKSLTSIANTAKDAHSLVDAIRGEIREALQTIRDAIEDGPGRGAPGPAQHLKSA